MDAGASFFNNPDDVEDVTESAATSIFTFVSSEACCLSFSRRFVWSCSIIPEGSSLA